MRFLYLILLLCLQATAQAMNPVSDTLKPQRVKNVQKLQFGIASYYHSKFEGRATASGELYAEKEMTAAHNGLPFNTWVRVTHLKNKRSVVVRINDRLHYRNTRVIDLSRAAAEKLGLISKGLARVKVEVLGKEKPDED